VIKKYLGAVLAFSLFTSKSGVGGLSPIMALMSLFEIFKKNRVLLKNSTFLKAVLALYPLALILNLFSLGGLESSLQVLLHWYFPLLAFSGILLFLDSKATAWVIRAGLFGFLVGGGYTIFQFLNQDPFVSIGKVRLGGFWDIGRWATLQGFSALALAGLFLGSLDIKSFKKNVGFGLLFLFCLFIFLLANGRAPMLGFIVAFGVFFCLKPKLIYLVLPLLFLLIFAFSFSPSLRERVISIAKVEKAQDGTVTSQDKSNEGRLYMWQVAIEFFKEQALFGVGFRNTEEPLKEYLDKNPSLRDRYVTTEFSFRDQHSSYLYILVEFGLIFFLYFWSIMFWAFFRAIQSFRNRRSVFNAFLVSLFIYHFIIFIFYSSVNSYEMLSFFPFLAIAGLNHKK